MDDNLSITELSLPVALVAQIVEAWLNEHKLREPHRVKRIDVVDAYDPDGVVRVEVELLHPTVEQKVEQAAVDLGNAHLVEALGGEGASGRRTNGKNGHVAPLPRRLVVQEAGKRPVVSDEQKQFIRERMDRLDGEIVRLTEILLRVQSILPEVLTCPWGSPERKTNLLRLVEEAEPKSLLFDAALRDADGVTLRYALALAAGDEVREGELKRRLAEVSAGADSEAGQ